MEEDAALIKGENAVALGDHRAVFAKFIIRAPEGFTALWIEAVEAFVASVKVNFSINDNR